MGSQRVGHNWATINFTKLNSHHTFLPTSLPSSMASSSAQPSKSFMVLPPSSHILKHYLFWLCLVFIAACGLSLIAVSVGSAHSGYSCCGALTLEHMGSMVVAHGLSCSQARGILPHQGQNSCPLPWPVDTQPGWTTSTLVDHQGSPLVSLWHKLPLASGLASSSPMRDDPSSPVLLVCIFLRVWLLSSTR